MVRLSYKYHTRHDLCPTANDATPFFFAAGLQQLDVKHENLQVDIPLMAYHLLQSCVPVSLPVYNSTVDGRLLPEPRSLLQLSYTCNQNRHECCSPIRNPYLRLVLATQ
ncbi:hypothetical protein PSTT_04589 [Puccinia striiformis]|uniref:Uncharacterized protein n=1 Tax=Puccinia striiformis TaxID=27350 RepID=A0A2S4VRW7_9BASI|nr:hypothetical protein PSTT_04589 [Puccinia striiformis]